MPQDAISTIDGTLDFSQGVDSHLVTTMQSALNPNGLSRNQLSWLVNGTIRNGGISPRSGWENLGTIMKNPGLFQGGFMYQPLGDTEPYLIFLMSGHLYAVQNVDEASVVIDLSAQFNLYMPATVAQATRTSARPSTWTAPMQSAARFSVKSKV